MDITNKKFIPTLRPKVELVQRDGALVPEPRINEFDLAYLSNKVEMGLTDQEIAILMQSSEKEVKKMRRIYGLTYAGKIEGYRGQRKNLITNLESNIVASLTVDTIDQMDPFEKVKALESAHRMTRLEEGKSTSNVESHYYLEALEEMK